MHGAKKMVREPQPFWSNRQMVLCCTEFVAQLIDLGQYRGEVD